MISRYTIGIQRVLKEGSLYIKSCRLFALWNLDKKKSNIKRCPTTPSLEMLKIFIK